MAETLALLRPTRRIAFLALVSLLLALWPGAAAAQMAAGKKKAALPFDPDGIENFSISYIQSPNAFSPLADKIVGTFGVVTFIARDGSGFWIQHPQGDGDPRTSDGLYVHLGREPQVERPAVGDDLWIIGKIVEEQYGIALPRTRMQDVVLLEVRARRQPLPAPIVLDHLPDTDLHEGIEFWERLEGMRVAVEDAIVVSPANRFNDFVVLSPGNAVPGKGYHPSTHALIVRDLGGGEVDYNPERIMVSARGLEKADDLRPGDRIVAMTGVVDFSFGNYKVLPIDLELEKKPRPSAPPFSRRSGPMGSVRITDYNLSNFFDTEDDPDTFDENYNPGSARLGTPSEEEVDRRLWKFSQSIIHELELPQVMLSQEFESKELLQRVGDLVNAEAGTRYTAVSEETSDRRGLEAGFLYDAARVELVDAYQLRGPEVELAFGLKSPYRNREPMVAVFRFAPGAPPVTVIANKFKSKRIDAPILNVNAEPVRVTEPQRKAQARVIRDFVDSLLAEDPEAMILVAGDFGDFPFAEPGEGEHAIGIIEGGEGEVRFRNLIELEDEAERYSWIFQGNGQTLSHMLASPALAKRCVAVDFLHFNAPFPNRLSADPTTWIRASDRDPLEARFDLEAAAPSP